MPDKPSAELEIDRDLVRALVSSQARSIPDAAAMNLRHLADGWDCSVWRLGEALAVRLPRRALAAPLVLHEQAVLAGIAERLAGSGVGVPAPIVAGRPGHGYPWSWSIVPYFPGSSGLGIPRSDRAGWAVPLADVLLALHVAAGPGFPVNPVRGVPLAAREDAVAARLLSLAGRVPDADLSRARELWGAALAAPPWSEAAVWVHGDLHPGNLIANRSRLTAVIDFGDVTAGDPAYDLAVAWLAFDPIGRAAFLAALGDRYDPPTWVRARGWAVAVALMMLDESDDNPEYAALGAEALAELS